MGRNVFCRSEYKCALAIRLFRILDNNLLTAGVRAISQKLLGEAGSSLVESFGISLTAPSFQVEGTVTSMITLLQRSKRAGWREGHHFKIVYEMQLKGDGEEGDLDFLITQASSSAVTGDICMVQPCLGGEGVGIQARVWKTCRED